MSDLTLQHSRIHSCRILFSRNIKCRTVTSLQWTHTVQQTQMMELPVNLYSHWNSMSLHWSGLCYCVMWLRREIWRNVKVTVCGDVTLYSWVDKSTSLHQVDTFLTKLHGVTCWKTVTFTFIVQWNLSKLTTDRCWKSGQHTQVVSLHRCVPK